MTLIVLEAILQWLNLVCYVVPNALNVVNACHFLGPDWFYFGFARWTCWNTVSHLDFRCNVRCTVQGWYALEVCCGNTACTTALACVLAATVLGVHLCSCLTAALAKAAPERHAQPLIVPTNWTGHSPKAQMHSTTKCS